MRKAMMPSISEIFYSTYAQAMFMDVPHRARFYPEPIPLRRGKPIVASLTRALGRASGRALVRLAAALEAGGRRLGGAMPDCGDPAAA